MSGKQAFQPLPCHDTHREWYYLHGTTRAMGALFAQFYPTTSTLWRKHNPRPTHAWHAAHHLKFYCRMYLFLGGVITVTSLKSHIFI